jgi:peptide/nickel transport system permease protein
MVEWVALMRVLRSGMIAEGKEVLDEAPHISLIPALILFLTVLSFNIIGDSLKRVLDSKEGQL